ncbi:Inactive serine protease PAMR1 [Orchesella cincta]|uniref:Inactive serine protease PAMR1 n=1 Tax=Orchesella cincta TaxID=48709 RepID=A0A1D2MIA2_ORCCI|nr:Inactive serine protease PAMR1 [Orchesella cincta]
MGQFGISLLVASFVAIIAICLGAATETGDARLKAPWTAAIFRKVDSSKDQWEFICSGAITGRYTVITSARCVIPRVSGPKFSSRPHHIRYSDLQVVVGLPTSDLASKDQYTQFGTVGQIRDIYDPNNGDTPEGDIAVIRLKNVLNLSTPYVKEVQLLEKPGTLMEAKETKSGEILQLSGYEKARNGVQTRAQSKSSSPLKVSEIKIEEVGKCIEHYTAAYPTFYFNALCGVAVKKSDIIPCYYEGSGLVKKVKDASGAESYHLFGVYSSNTAWQSLKGL